jgi:hypothetical protein
VEDTYGGRLAPRANSVVPVTGTGDSPGGGSKFLTVGRPKDTARRAGLSLENRGDGRVEGSEPP